MTNVPDAELLAEFTRNNSEAAFATLVERHIGLVYSVALRHTANPQHAQDITQAVFIVLARKAGALGCRTVLPGWLYRTARLTAANFQRAEARRVRREQEAFMQSTLEETPTDALWRELSPQLDEAMDCLGGSERDALVLRYFQNKTVAEVGKFLGLKENAAQKRVSRALEKLRKFFTKCGVVSTTAIIAGAISANSVQATPAGLAQIISAVSITKGVAASTTTLTLVKGALKIMAWTKTKSTVAVGLGLLLVAGTVATVTLKEAHEHEALDWQKKYDLSFLDRLPPQIALRPSLPSTLQSGLHVAGNRDGKALGLGQSVQDLLMMAYGVGRAQIIWDTPMPPGKYDFIANLPSGNIEAGQKGIQKTFGLACHFQTMETNVLILVKSRNAPGLRHTRGQFSGYESNNTFSAEDQNLWTLDDYLELILGIVVVDQTGLNDSYDIDFKWDSTPEGLKQVLSHQLGLELVPTNMPTQMLVVEKAK